MEHAYAVIMAGGGGTRLWPVSRKNKPKQLIPLLGEETLLQSTVSRLSALFPPERILIVTIPEQVAEIRAQVPSILAENYLIEPSPRGTASVVGLAAAILNKRDPQASMAILPSDHHIRNLDLFNYLMHTAFDVAKSDYLVTLGITPTFPSTAYGYIQQDMPTKEKFNYPVYTVKKFVEKPDEQTAQQLIRTGNHSWNSGMFIWKTEMIMAEFARQTPALYSVLTQIAEAEETERETVIQSLWKDLQVETIDYAIMEKAEKVAVLPASGLGWNDVGSWNSLFEVLLPDMNGNISINGQHLALDTHNTLVFGSGKERVIATIGIDDIVIVDMVDALLVCKTDQAQAVREVVAHLKKYQQERYL
ncbi:MAG: mannose-1-phosphate guanylyltransferase [Chloroflexota bacterium]